jgi:hypothetical protein
MPPSASNPFSIAASLPSSLWLGTNLATGDQVHVDQIDFAGASGVDLVGLSGGGLRLGEHPAVTVINGGASHINFWRFYRHHFSCEMWSMRGHLAQWTDGGPPSLPCAVEDNDVAAFFLGRQLLPRPTSTRSPVGPGA